MKVRTRLTVNAGHAAYRPSRTKPPQGSRPDHDSAAYPSAAGASKTQQCHPAGKGRRLLPRLPSPYRVSSARNELRATPRTKGWLFLLPEKRRLRSDAFRSLVKERCRHVLTNDR
jgi:hypothetical protein